MVIVPDYPLRPSLHFVQPINNNQPVQVWKLQVLSNQINDAQQIVLRRVGFCSHSVVGVETFLCDCLYGNYYCTTAGMQQQQQRPRCTLRWLGATIGDRPNIAIAMEASPDKSAAVL